ncbi:hypothetical protein MCOR19_008550 [Pyricularia oryzae]|nr:hypothetical protein MCOR19_008550 [Pyricularia oryzae]KAI6594732.1 hypothetical protein MCOR06_003194 [Pyricularia oryzae]
MPSQSQCDLFMPVRDTGRANHGLFVLLNHWHTALDVIQRMEERGTRRGVLVTLEEAQIGVGCVGHVFAFEDGIAPDILSLLKTLGCGLRLASASTAAEMEACCVDVGHLWLTGIHFSDPFTATVGCQVLDIVARD